MKKKISFLSLLLASFLIVMALASCKGQNQGGGATPEFKVSVLKLWGKNILSKKNGDKVELSGSDGPKILQVTETMVKDYTVSVIVDDEEPITKATKTGIVKLDLKKLPETEKGMLIKLSANGVNEWSESILVQMVRGVAGDLKVAFANEDDNNVERFIPKGKKPTFSTTKDKGKITLKTSSSEMSKVIIDGNDVTTKALAADKKSATYELPIAVVASQKQAVKVEVEFEYFLKATAEFEVAKYANSNEFPMDLLSATITSGENHVSSIDFDAQNKATIKLSDIMYAVVGLDMEFSTTLSKREVMKCTDRRPTDYNTKISDEAAHGVVSGYLVAEVDFTKDFEETKLTQIDKTDKRKYHEILIVGYGTVSYEIKFIAENKKEKTYTIEIINETEPVRPDQDPLFKSFEVKNLASTVPVHLHLQRTLNLPFYCKGSCFNPVEGNKLALNSSGITDLAYMDSFAMVVLTMPLRDGDTLKKFNAYYNVFSEESGAMKDKHEFKRVKGGYLTKYPNVGIVIIKIKDLNDKCLDFFLAGKEGTPYLMLPLYYGQKWRRMAPKHGFVITLNNKQTVGWPEVYGNRKLSSDFAFETIYNYRVQSVIADNLNKTSGTDPKELTIYKNLKSFKHWEAGTDFSTLRKDYMVGKTATDKDIFTLSPTFREPETGTPIVQALKYTIKKKKADSDEYENDTTFNSYEAKVAKGGGYIIGARKENPEEATYAFEDGNIYKVEVEVEYNEVSGKDKFHYVLDYKSKDKTVEIMDIADDMDMGGNLFGLPTSYGVKTIDPAIWHDITTARYTSLQDMSSYVK
ncbi:MAG: hypothetical protein ACTTIZ_00660 [Treponema sp.]